MLKQGAFAVLREDPAKSAAASQAFAEASIEELLARAHDASEVIESAAASGEAASPLAETNGGDADARGEGEQAAAVMEVEDPSFWLQVADEAQEKLGRGARRRGQPTETLADVDHSDLSDSDSDSDGSDGSDGSGSGGGRKKKRKRKKEEKERAAKAAEKAARAAEREAERAARAAERRLQRRPRRRTSVPSQRPWAGPSSAVAPASTAPAWGVVCTRTRARCGWTTPRLRCGVSTRRPRPLPPLPRPRRRVPRRRAREREQERTPTCRRRRTPRASMRRKSLPRQLRRARRRRRPAPPKPALRPVPRRPWTSPSWSSARSWATRASEPRRASSSSMRPTSSSSRRQPGAAGHEDGAGDAAAAEETTEGAPPPAAEASGANGDAAREPHRPKLISLAMLEDVAGAYAGKYDRFLPSAPKEEKAAKDEKEPKPDKGWSKADRDKAVKAVASLGVADVPRLARLLGKKAEHMRLFVDGYLSRLLEAAAKGTQDLVSEAALGRVLGPRPHGADARGLRRREGQ